MSPSILLMPMLLRDKRQQMIDGVVKGPMIKLHHAQVETNHENNRKYGDFFIPAVLDQGWQLNRQDQYIDSDQYEKHSLTPLFGEFEGMIQEVSPPDGEGYIYLRFHAAEQLRPIVFDLIPYLWVLLV